MRTYDVVILGSGIAGGFLTRQLKLARPDLSILVLESAEKIDDYKVGESTVEVAAHYMIRKLNLGTYLYQHQLPKNGLRFFFDNESEDLPLTEMSEIGSDHMPYHPSFQLERARLERDLITMNRESGALVLTGAKVTDVSINEAGPHTVWYEYQGEKVEVRARWLCDASGRRQLVARKLGQKIQKETRLNTAAGWARYWNVAGLDAVRDHAWRSRVRYTSRHLSTNHMMYDGYWIWFIPLAGDLMSVGVVYDKDRIGPGPRGRDAFEAFIKSHRSSRDLMEGAVFEDYQGYAHLPYHVETFFSANRWGLTGEAGAFVDPFYSPGSDFIATANEFLTSLIITDFEGKSNELPEREALYNAFYKLKYEATLRLYSKLYPIFGSYEIYRVKYLLDFNNYYNLVVWPFMADKLTNCDWLREELKFGDFVLRAQGAIADMFAKWGETLRKEGRYFAQNQGHWANGLNGVVQFQEKLGPVLDENFRKEELDKAYSSVFATVVENVLGAPGLSNRRRVLSELSLPHVVMLKDLKDGTVEQILKRASVRLTRDLKSELPSAGIERVSLEKNNGGDVQIRVTDNHNSLIEEAAVLARAKELWDEPGQPLTQIRM
ncbi:MAG: NAD(P)/FAD-dependent oxidoreductase [Polyangiaceae bacterium]|nr:NAD(P)/FAD-dependent oxidoreductase [Polyangiaceae bacterium]